MKLDFNSKSLKFEEDELQEYNVDIIYDNIEKFKRFARKYVIDKTFDLVFEHDIFQTELLSEKCYLDDLLVMYNALAQPQIIGTEIPEISRNELKNQLRIRGYKLIPTNRTMSRGQYVFTHRVEKDLSYNGVRE